MKSIVLKIMIGVMLIVISACANESVPIHHDPFNGSGEPLVYPNPTVGSINTAANDGFAHDILVQFFDHLHAGHYEEAVGLYGGDYQLIIDQNPETDPADHATLMKYACMYNGYQCLKIKLAGIEYKSSPDEYVFGVQFQNEDGSVFVLGPCCGASETEQPTRFFFRDKSIEEC